LGTHDIAGIARQLTNLQNAGHDPAQVARQLAKQLRTGLIAGKPALPSSVLLQLLTKLIDVPASSSPRGYLEIALLDTALSGVEMPGAAVVTQTSKSGPLKSAPKATEKPTPKEETKVMSEPAQSTAAVVTEPHPSTFQKRIAHHAEDENETGPTSNTILNDDFWPQILSALKQKHNTIYTLARTAKPTFSPGTVTLEFGFAFHQKRLNENKNKQVIADIVESITGENMKIVCTVGEGATEPVIATPMLPPEGGEVVHSVAVPPVPPAPVAATVSLAPAAPTQPQNEVVSTISNIFGGAEVLES
jgi:hypothetical protein